MPAGEGNEIPRMVIYGKKELCVFKKEGRETDERGIRDNGDRVDIHGIGPSRTQNVMGSRQIVGFGNTNAQRII